MPTTPATNNSDTVTISTEDARKLQQMADSFTILQEQLTQLQKQVKQQSAPIPEYSYPLSFQEPIVGNPELFNGTKHLLDPFITQVKLVIQVQPSRFITERQKVLFTASFLHGAAAKWFQPLFNQNPPSPLLDNFEEFLISLNTSFGGLDDAHNAVSHLTHLVQSQSVSNYSAEFKRLSPHTGWNDAALSYQFYQGLKSNVKDELARCARPENLSKLIESAISIDNRIHERILERNTNQSRRYQFTPNITTQQSSSDKMVIDTAKLQRTSQPRGPLTNEEYQYRIANKLCLYCGQSNHMISNCPLKQKTTRPTQVATLTSGPSIPIQTPPTYRFDQGNFNTQF